MSPLLRRPAGKVLFVSLFVNWFRLLRTHSEHCRLQVENGGESAGIVHVDLFFFILKHVK